MVGLNWVNRIHTQINEIMKLDIDNNYELDIIRSELIYDILVKEYGWDDVQQALFQALIDDRNEDKYTVIAETFWNAVEDKLNIDADKAVALINYRCNPFDKPYEDNLAWSFTSKIYNLDYVDSEYNAFRDEKILSILKEYFTLP